MSKTEIGELCAIPLAGIAVWLAASALPTEVGLGQLLLTAFGLLLLQSLLRDLWLLRAARAAAASSEPREASCMCVESTVGAVGIVLGAAIALSGLPWSVNMSALGWVGLVLGVLIVGFAIKDFVISWRPLRLLRDKDHLNIVVRLR